MNLSFGHRSIGPLTVIWLTAFAAAQAQITPFTTQPAASSQASPTQQQPGQSTTGVAPVAPGQTTAETIRPNYELGPSDQIMIQAPDADELNGKTFRVEDDGTATLPLVGVVKMGGMTVAQVEDDLKDRLKTYIRNPVVTIQVVQFRSAPVFFVGQFQRPGIYALSGRHTLVEMLQGVGGLTPTAARRIKITRKNESGPIPLSSAIEDPGGKTSSVEISLVSLTQNINPAEDIVLQPYDIITVDRAESVYLLGAIKSAPIALNDRDSISILQVIAESGGLPDDAQLKKAYILRPVLDTARRAKIPVDLTKVMSTEGNDYPLLANDILVVPAKRKFDSPLITRLEGLGFGVISSLLIYGLLNHGI